MNKRWVGLIGLALVSGCGGAKDQRRQAAEDRRDIAMVERMNQAPFRPATPEPLTEDDLGRYDLLRSGCVFRPGDKPNAPALFVAQRDRGYLKVAGVLQPLAAKSGSAELPGGAHAIYMGLDSWIELVAQAGKEQAGADGKQAWPSRLVIHDAQQRVSFNALGRVSCTGGEEKDAA